MAKLHKLLNSILSTDSYKASMWVQYPADTTHISSYIEARGGEDESVFFGLQAFIKEYLLNPITMEDIDRAEKLILAHGEPFNRAGWEIIVNEYDGFLPIEIEAVPEGTVMPTSNIQVQIINTDPRLFWLTSYIETALLRGVWYPSTVATKSRKFKKLIWKALEKTSDNPPQDQIGFKLHDFGARGASSTETAALGGMAHLVNFMGTDTIEGMVAAMEYYNLDEVPGFSIPASEHSIATSHTSAQKQELINWKEGSKMQDIHHELNYIRKMLSFFDTHDIVALVGDSYDIFHFCDLLGEIKDEILEKTNDGKKTLVVRPDSGDPTVVPLQVIEKLMEKFGFTVNSKGYRVLPSCVRVIQGDGINEESLAIILENMVDSGLSVDNIAFGMGGGLLQAWNRDTLRYAMKASARKSKDGKWHDVYKDPITDHGKRSKRGRLMLVESCGIGNCSAMTVRQDEFEGKQTSLLRPVFRNGKLLIDEKFDRVKERAKL